jgi:MYXO-CTERM domain-containing protein
MTVQDVSLTGSELSLVSAPPAGTTLAAGAQTTAQVQFAATASGDATGTLTVTYDGGRTRTAEISARALATSMSLTPDGAIDFGPVCSGQSKTQELLVLANDEGSFRIEELTTPDGPFTVDATMLPLVVEGGGATQVALPITATPAYAGRMTETTTLRTDIPGAALRDITLTVEGLPSGVSGTPAELEFGSTPLGMTTLGQNVSVTNCSPAPVELTNARIEGEDADQFAIVLPPASSTVAPSGSASWLVVSQPRTAGPKQARFVVDHPEGSVTITLVGEGLGEGTAPLDDDTGRASYYACSTGNAASSWPVGLALALLAFRRRSRGRRS